MAQAIGLQAQSWLTVEPSELPLPQCDRCTAWRTAPLLRPALRPCVPLRHGPSSLRRIAPGSRPPQPLSAWRWGWQRKLVGKPLRFGKPLRWRWSPPSDVGDGDGGGLDSHLEVPGVLRRWLAVDGLGERDRKTRRPMPLGLAGCDAQCLQPRRRAVVANLGDEESQVPIGAPRCERVLEWLAGGQQHAIVVEALVEAASATNEPKNPRCGVADEEVVVLQLLAPHRQHWWVHGLVRQPGFNV